MTQPVLPFYSPRERGRLNAVRNLLASVDDELRRRAGVAQEIVVFVARELPTLFSEFSPLTLESASHQNPFLLSERPFELKDFSFNQNRPDVFSSTTELLQNVDVERLAAGLQGVELTGIDESKVDAPLPYSSMAFLRSIAFRMYRSPNGEQDEAVGPLLSELRLRLRDSEGFELENQLLGYLRNTYIAYITSLTALAAERTPFVVLHGPLVRAIGGFSHLSFDYETAKRLLDITVGEAGEFDLPQYSDRNALNGDAQTANNLPLTEQVYGLALGSMVPRRKRGSFDEVIDFVRAARKTMPAEMRLHVFGVTGIMVPYLIAEGVDSCDSSRYVQDARALKYLNPEARRALSWKHLSSYPCQCQICRSRDIYEDHKIMRGELKERQKSEVYASIALHNLELDFGIVRETIEAKAAGDLKAYLQSLSNRFPTLHLPRLNGQRAKVTVQKQTIRSHTRRDYDLRRRRWQPNDGAKVVLILPCSQEKPYTRSSSFKAVYSHLERKLRPKSLEQIDLVFLSGLYGPVPEEHAYEDPVKTYDFLLHKKDVVGISEISNRLSAFITRFSSSYEQIVAYSTHPAYRSAIYLAFLGRERVRLLPERGRMGRTAFYKVENLENLVEVLRSHLERKKGKGRQS